MRTGRLIAGFAAVCSFASALSAQEPLSPGATSGALMDEDTLMARIRFLGEQRRSNVSLESQLEVLAPALIEAVRRVDELLTRFPQTKYREEAIGVRLAALSELALARPEYLDELARFTAELLRIKPGPELESEAAYYAIQAFVLGARAEGMEEQRRLLGTLERYQAFLEEYPQSRRRAVIYASLIRNLMALRRLDEAERELEKLRKEYPTDPATLRAEGELRLAKSIGKPFRTEFTSYEGQRIETSELKGKVVVLHFWATWSERSLAQLEELRQLHAKYADKGLVLLGVNADKSRKAFENQLAASRLTWPQSFEQGKGLGNKLVVEHGITVFPSYLLVDRQGILRELNTGLELSSAVGRLMDETEGVGEGTP